MKILVINAGSSSHKLSLYDIKDLQPVEPLWKATIDWGRGGAHSFLVVTVPGQCKMEKSLENSSIQEGLQILLTSLWQGSTQVISGLSAIESIGHRVVHGGRAFQCPTLINDKVKAELHSLIPLAPLHNPANLQGIEIMEQHFPHIPQIAVFDTAFHAQMPEKVKAYPVPYAWKAEGIERYGFHGISHQYCAERAAALLQKEPRDLKMINCHLGNGASLCAIKDGKSVDTTMGFTPMEGLMMGSRCGSIDSGILLYLLREKKYTVEDLDAILNFNSGLKGIAGTSDMREILASQEARAQLAFEMYNYRLKGYIGALITQLEGIDTLIFTGGVGENAAAVREATCQGLKFLGVELDVEKNLKCQPDQDVALLASKVRILVIHTREEWMIARECFVFTV